MIRIFLPLICAALGFAAASCSQAGGPLAPPEAPAPARATSQDTAAAAMAMGPQGAAEQTADTSPDAPASTPVERRASMLIGMPVVSADGSSLGKVKDIIFDRQGRATHVVIAYGAEPETGQVPGTGAGRLTAMPWDAAMASIKDGRLVLDGAKLQAAPSFTPDAWPNFDDPAWSATTDAYWRKAVRAAIAAHPGTPIDSTARRRARPTRDGD